jgi:hypothetical protein
VYTDYNTPLLLLVVVFFSIIMKPHFLAAAAQPLLLLLLAAATTPSASAQFTCTFAGASDVKSCTAATDDSASSHCVWCALGGGGGDQKEDPEVQDSLAASAVSAFGFCVSESQAEAMEQSLPGIHCDRYSGKDDDGTEPATDDGAAPVASDDDKSSPDKTDDDNKVPDDFWTCLENKDSAKCKGAGCTWCDGKTGYGLCMSGPAADSASKSDFFKCEASTGSSSSRRQDLILLEEPDEDDVEAELLLTLQDPYDPSCLMVYLKDQSKTACEASIDADGTACEFCFLRGAPLSLCLTADQAETGQAFGLDCGGGGQEELDGAVVALAEEELDDPYDSYVIIGAVSCVRKFVHFWDVPWNRYFFLTRSVAILYFCCTFVNRSCLLAYLEDASKDACLAAVDAEGSACEFCTLQGSLDLCLTAEQAAMGEQLGITCETSVTDLLEAQTERIVQDPYDPSCLVAYLQDSTQDSCLTATDADGNACEYCTLQGALDLCLNAEQAEMGAQLGITCNDMEPVPSQLQDPYDPSCAMAYLQNPTEEGCHTAVDADGNGCEYCQLQGALNLCLNVDQAAMGEEMGITCDVAATDDEEEIVVDPFDASCMAAFFGRQSQDDCVNAVDQAGQPCEYCNLPGSFAACLNSEQAEIGKELGMECQESKAVLEIVQDPYDTACAFAYLQDPSKDGCLAAVDEDGLNCEFCSVQGTFSVCLTSEQAEIGEEFGVSCGKADLEDEVALPPDFLDCLEHYEKGDCHSSSCTWCNTQVGIGFCLAPAAAEATKQCSFFDCEFQAGKQDDNTKDIYDPVCLTAGAQAQGDDKPSICAQTTGTDGAPCVWCDAAGVFGLCLSDEQANASGQYLQCGENKSSIAIQ